MTVAILPLSDSFWTLCLEQEEKVSEERFHETAYEDVKLRISEAINLVIHLAARYPRNPDKIEHAVADIELRKIDDLVASPATDKSNMDTFPKPA